MNDLFDIIKQIKETDLESILKSLSDNNIQYELLSDKETRPVYILKDFNLVVKIAKNLAGLNQNKTECHPVFNTYSDVFNIPLAWSSNFYIVLYKKADSFSYMEDNYAFTNIYNLHEDYLITYCNPEYHKEYPEDLVVVEENISKLGSRFIEAMLAVHNSTPELKCWGLPADYAKSSSYGIVEGTIKIIDFGLTDYTDEDIIYE